MVDDGLIDGWKTTCDIDNFLSLHLSGMTNQTIKIYYEFMSSFVTFACNAINCVPAELNFSKYNRIEIGDEIVHDQIDPEVVSDFLATIPYETSRELAARVLRTYFDFLLEDRVLRYNPAPPRRAPNNIPKQNRTVNLLEVEKLVRYLRTQRTPYSFALLIQNAAGLRIGEALALRLDDVSQTQSGTWDISIQREESNKGKSAAKLPLPDAGELMNEWMEWRSTHGITSEYMFAHIGNKPLIYSTIRNYLHKSCAHLGINRLQLHDLRRAYATLIDQMIDDPEILPQALHHSRASNVVTRRYVSPASVEEVNQELSKLKVTKLVEKLASDLKEGARVYQFPGLTSNDNLKG